MQLQPFANDFIQDPNIQGLDCHIHILKTHFPMQQNCSLAVDRMADRELYIENKIKNVMQNQCHFIKEECKCKETTVCVQMWV